MADPITKWLLTPPNGTAIRQQIMPSAGGIGGVYAGANAIIIEFATERKEEMLEWLMLELTKFEHGDNTPQAQHWKAAAEKALLDQSRHPPIPPEIAVMGQPAPPITVLPAEVRLAAQAAAAPTMRNMIGTTIPGNPGPPSAPAPATPLAEGVIRVVPDIDTPPMSIAEKAIASSFNPLVDACPTCGGKLELKWAGGMVAIKCSTQGCLGVAPPAASGG